MARGVTPLLVVAGERIRCARLPNVPESPIRGGAYVANVSSVTYLADGPSDRAQVLVTVVLVIVGLAAVLIVMALVGSGLKAVLVRLKQATFTRPGVGYGELKAGPLAYLWGVFAAGVACLAFVFSAGWLWAVAIVAGLLLALVNFGGDENITN